MRYLRSATAIVLVSGVLAASASARPTDNFWPLRAHYRASTYTHSTQAEAVLCIVPDAGHESVVVAWSSRRQNQGRSGVFGQRFSTDGTPIEQEFPLAIWNESHQTSPALAAGSDGSYVAAWQSFGQDGHAGSIIARTFRPDADGRLRGGREVLVNERWRGDQSGPVVASLPDGRSLVAWVSSDGPSAGSRVACRVLSRYGNPVGPEISLSEQGSDASRPTIAPAPGSQAGFAVAFASRLAGGAPDGLRVALIAPDGTMSSPAQRIDAAGGNAIEPAIVSTEAGLTVAWMRAGLLPTDADHAVMACALGARGEAIGAAHTISTSVDASHSAPSLSARADGGVLIAFNTVRSGRTVLTARALSPSAEPLGEAFPLSDAEAQSAALHSSGAARSASSRDGSVHIAWSGDCGSGDAVSANVSILSTGAALALSPGVTPQMRPAPGAGAPQDTSNPLAEPHRPPTFNPLDIDAAEREIDLKDGRSIGFTGITSTGWTPPDPHMAVGPTHVVLMTNGAIAYFRKSDGFKEFQQDINGAGGFWGAQGALNFMFDPEVLFDGLSSRFFAMAAEGQRADGKSYFYLAVSDDSSPAGAWHKYRFETTALAGNLFDSPNIGVTADAVIVTGDGFGISANYPVYSVNKALVLAGLPAAISASTTLTTSTQSAGIPPVSYDAPPALYMIEHKEASNNTQVRLIALTNALTTPTITSINLTVPSYGPPEDPPQSGTTTRPETFDGRFWNVAYRNGSLWATHHAGASRVLARWYQIAMNGWPTSGSNPTLVQSGIVDPGATVRTSFSAITVAPNGNAALAFARSSPTEFLSLATTHRLYCDTLGTTQPVTIRKSSDGPYGSARWGDYAAIQTDPSDDHTFWACHEWSQGGSWRTWIESFTVGFCAGECVADFNSDSFVNGVDFDLFLDAFIAGDASADVNEDAFVNGIDFDYFVDHFYAGC